MVVEGRKGEVDEDIGEGREVRAFFVFLFH
jgi:hypothetical protein